MTDPLYAELRTLQQKAEYLTNAAFLARTPSEGRAHLDAAAEARLAAQKLRKQLNERAERTPLIF